tara:strand:+ start:281 stop:604 length:324 start_codon:yes stop_codon:yes gene_type:complete
MNTSTKKWILLKASSLVLLPLMMWFILNFSFIALSDPIEIISLLTSQPGKILFSVFIIVAFFFFSLTISEIFEDYMRNEKIKNVANKSLYIFAILFSIITIINIYKI